MSRAGAKATSNDAPTSGSSTHSATTKAAIGRPVELAVRGRPSGTTRRDI